MNLKFLQKIKKQKAELEEVKKITEEIKKVTENFKQSENFCLTTTGYGQEFLKGCTTRSITEKNSCYIKHAYQVLTDWDNYGFIPMKVGKWLEELISREDIQIGVHRTGGYGLINPKDVYSSNMLYNIFNKGLYITGDISSGVEHKGEIIPPNKNISPINNILEAVILLKSSYKSSTGGIITAIPSKYITPNYEIKKGYESEIYTIEDNQWTLKPEFLIGFISQDKGRCTFYSKEQILNNYKGKEKKN